MRILLAALAPAALLAQSLSLSGLIKDASASAVADAGITVLHSETGTERIAKSDCAGIYVLTSLLPGHYRVRVEAKGFQVRIVENVELGPRQNARLDFTLEGSFSEVRGLVTDASGEQLANVQIQLAGTAHRAISDGEGSFRLGAIPAGDYVLNVSTVGFHMEKHAIHLEAGEIKEFEVVLTPDTLRQTATVAAKTDPFETARGDSPDALSLAGTDAKNLGTVIVDDPLRSVQGLPGVVSDRDYDARFSLRGVGFDRIGLFLDGIQLHSPLHIVDAYGERGTAPDGTVAVFNGDMVESMELHKSAFPARFADSSGGVLDVATRDGGTGLTRFRISASSSAVTAMSEGPIGGTGGGPAKGSWVVAVRKSYLQYVLSRTSAPMFFDMEDVQARVSYNLTPKNTVTLSAIEGFSNQDRSNNQSGLGINSVLKARYDYTLANLGWRYTPNAKLLVVSHAAWMREKHDDQNPQVLPLAGGYYGEWVANTAATWMWSEKGALEAGGQVRRIRNWDFANQYQSPGGVPIFLDHANGTAVQYGGYAQQTQTIWAGRIRLSAGGRWDRSSIDRVGPFSPQASASIGLTASTHLVLGWGEYTQYPELSVFLSPFGNRGLLPIRSIHSVVAVDRRLGQRTHLRLETYQRDDRDLPFQPTYDPRIVNGLIFNPPDPLYSNSLRGHSRGAEVFLQRSSANRVTGWISYAYGKTTMREGAVAGAPAQQFPSDYDQRHTINIYGGFRLRPTINLSARSSYGSGFPIPGYLSLQRYAGVNSYFLAADRNAVRLSPYQRTDVRVNKSWMHARWKITLYGEAVNLTNHGNNCFVSFNGYNPQTRQVSISTGNTFPILPSAGTLVEW
jgi:hypothetical protein